jgi:hypothetical protein
VKLRRLTANAALSVCTATAAVWNPISLLPAYIADKTGSCAALRTCNVDSVFPRVIGRVHRALLQLKPIVIDSYVGRLLVIAVILITIRSVWMQCERGCMIQRVLKISRAGFSMNYKRSS